MSGFREGLLPETISATVWIGAFRDAMKDAVKDGAAAHDPEGWPLPEALSKTLSALTGYSCTVHERGSRHGLTTATISVEGVTGGPVTTSGFSSWGQVYSWLVRNHINPHVIKAREERSRAMGERRKEQVASEPIYQPDPDIGF